MSDIPTVDSSTSSNYPDATQEFKVEYNPKHEPQLNNFEINNETYIFDHNEENQANVTRTLENFELEETYDVHHLNYEDDEDDQVSEDEQSTPRANSNELVQIQFLLEPKTENENFEKNNEKEKFNEVKIATETECLLDELIEQVQSSMPVKSQVNSTSNLN